MNSYRILNPALQSALCGSSPCQRPLRGIPPFQICTVLTDLERPPLSERFPWPLTVPGLHIFGQTWNTCPCQSAFHGSSPFQVCTVLTDLERPPLSERSQWPLTVPGLRSFCRPGTPTPAKALSMALLRSRSAQFCQTWHTCPCQSTLNGLSPFQVCAVLTDLERSPLIELLLWHVPVPGLHIFGQTWNTRPCQSILCSCQEFHALRVRSGKTFRRKYTVAMTPMAPPTYPI